MHMYFCSGVAVALNGALSIGSVKLVVVALAFGRLVTEVGRPIDPSVTFTAAPLAPNMVSGSVAFGQLLASSGVIKDCSVQKVSSYAIGNMIRTYNTCEVNDIRTKSDGTIKSLFKQVALANILRARAGGMK